MPIEKLEIIIDTYALSYCSVAGADELEAPLDEALAQSGLGRVVDRMGGSGQWITTLEIDAARFDEALAQLRAVLKKMNLPPRTILKFRGKSYPLHEHAGRQAPRGRE
ncbi:MAG TPA: hypothetical protein VEK08_11995 [Planctomycetota bacterium]|nr:hypothetical protein [Planctomycetota bacterium]